MNTSLLQQVLEQIALSIQDSSDGLRTQLHLVFTVLAMYELIRVVYASFWRRALLGEALGLLLRTGSVWWVFNNYPTLLTGMQEWMMYLGVTAGGGRLTAVELLDPAFYLNYAFTAAAPIKAMMTASWGLWNATVALAYFLAWIGFLLAFGLLGIAVFIWQLEILICGTMLLIVIPTMLSRWTSFVGQQSLSYVVNATFRLAVSGFLVALAFPAIQRVLVIPQQPPLDAVILAVLTAWSIAIAGMHVNKLASSMLIGAVSLSASSVLSAAGAGALAVGTALSAGAAGAAGAGALVSTGARGALAVGGGVRGAITAGTSGGVRGLLSAATQGAQHSLTSPLAQRMGSFAGYTQRLAQSQAQQAVHRVWDTTRYVGSGDQSYGGVRR